MIINITLKDPDGIYDSIQEAAKQSLARTPGLDHEEAEAFIVARHKRISEALKPWIEYGEYVRLQIDLKAKTATVILNK